MVLCFRIGLESSFCPDCSYSNIRSIRDGDDFGTDFCHKIFIYKIIIFYFNIYSLTHLPWSFNFLIELYSTIAGIVVSELLSSIKNICSGTILLKIVPSILASFSLMRGNRPINNVHLALFILKYQLSFSA